MVACTGVFTKLDNNAYAHDVQADIPNGHVTKQKLKIKVPMKNARLASVDAVNTFAEGISNDGLLLIIYGKDASLLEDTKQVARNAIKSGKPMRGLVIGPVNEKPHVDVYADAVMINTSGLTNKSEISRVVDYAYTLLTNGIRQLN